MSLSAYNLFHESILARPALGREEMRLAVTIARNTIGFGHLSENPEGIGEELLRRGSRLHGRSFGRAREGLIAKGVIAQSRPGRGRNARTRYRLLLVEGDLMCALEGYIVDEAAARFRMADAEGYRAAVFPGYASAMAGEHLGLAPDFPADDPVPRREFPDEAVEDPGENSVEGGQQSPAPSPARRPAERPAETPAWRRGRSEDGERRRGNGKPVVGEPPQKAPRSTTTSTSGAVANLIDRSLRQAIAPASEVQPSKDGEVGGT